MRIAQIAPLVESVPPTLYGGTERVVSWLTEELVTMGHDVTLFASGDSRTRAKLEPMTPRALRLAGVHDCTPYNIIMLDKVAARQKELSSEAERLDALVTSKPSAVRPSPKRPVKYRDGENEWTGVGTKPAWAKLKGDTLASYKV
jgi:hypothetical protein